MRFSRILLAILDNDTVCKGTRIIEIQWNLKEDMSNFSVSIVPAERLARSGITTSTRKVMSKFGSHEYIYIHIYRTGTLTHCGLGDFNEILDEYFFKPITVIDGWDTCCEIALRRMSLDLTYDKSTLVQVMAWCRQATSHYLSQCWPRSLSPYGVTRPQWVNH